MREIPLTKGQVAIVDDEDYESLARLKWQAHHAGGRGGYYACHSFNQGGKVRSLWMHLVILDAPEGTEGDHINHNTLDNRRHNLRLATTRQNHQNMRKALRPSSSRYKGVGWRPSRRKWHARILANGRRLHLGYFRTEHEAATAYNKAALHHFGEFACLNDLVPDPARSAT